MWSIEEYCASQTTPWDITVFSESSSSRAFLEALALPTVHPFCHDYAFNNYSDYYLNNIPRQGPLQSQEHLETWHDVLVTIVAQVVPSIWAMAELWWRLLAFFVAPAGFLWLLQRELMRKTPLRYNSPYHSRISLVTLTSAMVLWKDELYVLEFGIHYGASLFVAAAILAWRTSISSPKTKMSILLICCIAAFSFFLSFPGSNNSVQFEEGLYYDTTQSHATRLVQHWPAVNRTYVPATPWMPTGDARTGLPFLMNRAPVVTWHRLWLPLPQDDDGEVIALDIAFPPHGHDTTNPLYLILHGLNGGSQEPYVREMAGRRLADGSTVVVMIARGLMDLPVRGWNVFHGARWTDVQEAARVLRRALGPQQVLAGVGYSMGGIVLSNYVARSGTECALDAAVAISGGLDMRVEVTPNRAHRLWQPIVAVELRDTFVVGKWGERVRSRLSKTQMKALMRATNIAGIDKTAVVVYNGFRDLMHYYSEMSALGDIPFEEFDSDAIAPSRRVHNISIPFCVLHALDDPLITWKTIASNHGWKHPSNLTRTGSGHLFLLLTKRGGHVGWPLGWLPFLHNWSFMNNAAASFVNAVVAAKREASNILVME